MRPQKEEREALSHNIKQLRIKSGKSLKEVAMDLGIAKTTYYSYETGLIENPTVFVCKRIADYYGMYIDELLRERY